MVSHGRALAVAAAWVILPLGAAAVAVGTSAARSNNEWDALIIPLALGGVVCVGPLALLPSAIWIARRASKARSAAALGTQAGLLGLAVAGLVVTLYVASHWN